MRKGRLTPLPTGKGVGEPPHPTPPPTHRCTDANDRYHAIAKSEDSARQPPLTQERMREVTVVGVREFPVRTVNKNLAFVLSQT